MNATVKPSMVFPVWGLRLGEGPVVQELLPSGLEGLDSPCDGPHLVADAAREGFSRSDSSSNARQRSLLTGDMVAMA